MYPIRYKVSEEKIREYSSVEKRVEAYYSVDMDRRMERYGLFLEEGDFEEFQQFCYMKRSRPEYQLLKRVASAYYNKDTPRHIWIRSRFVTYLSSEWKEMMIRLDQLLLTYKPAK